MQPWLPYSLAVRVIPEPSVRLTVCASMSTTVSTTAPRCWKGAVKPPTFAAASRQSSPVMKVPEQSVFAKPAVWCTIGSPGGGSHSVATRAIPRAITGP